MLRYKRSDWIQLAKLLLCLSMVQQIVTVVIGTWALWAYPSGTHYTVVSTLVTLLWDAAKLGAGSILMQAIVLWAMVTGRISPDRPPATVE